MLFFLNLSRGLGLHYFNHGLRHLGLVHASGGDVGVVLNLKNNENNRGIKKYIHKLAYGLVHASRGDVSVVTLKGTVDVSLKVSLKET